MQQSNRAGNALSAHFLNTWTINLPLEGIINSNAWYSTCTCDLYKPI